MMRSALCKSLDGPAGVDVVSCERPVPGPGQVLVHVHAAALNFLDTLITRGRYQFKPSLPFAPSAEISGVVAEVGEGVARLGVGERVCGYIGWGGAADYVAADADVLVSVPDAVEHNQAASINVTYGTAMHGFRDRGRLAAGETVAILGASGGAGLAAIEIAALLGARTIAVASSDTKLDVCRRGGADLLLNYKAEDLKQRLRDLTGGRGVDVVYDCVGGPHAEAALRSIAWEGRFLVVGFASGEIPQIPLNLVLLKCCDIIGVFWGEAVTRDPEAHRANMEQVLAWVAHGRLKPHLSQTFALEDIRHAISLLDARAATGKLVIDMTIGR